MLKQNYQKIRINIIKIFIIFRLNVFASDISFFTSFLYYLHWRICSFNNIKHVYNKTYQRIGFFAIPLQKDESKQLSIDRYNEINLHLSEVLYAETDFFHNLPTQSNSTILSNFIYDYIQINKNSIELALGSHFQIHRTIAYRTFPDNKIENSESSFAWHYDSAPFQMSKLFIYLDDTRIENGAFSYIDLISSRKLFRKGFVSSNGFRTISQALINTNLVKHFFEGKAGDSFIFNTSVIHRATYPTIGRRTIICLEIYPSCFPVSRSNIINSLALNVDKDYPAYPKFPWSNKYNKPSV